MPHKAKLCFAVVLKNFGGNSLKTSLFIPKIYYLRNKLRNTQKDYFCQQVWKGEKSEEILDLVETTVFVQSSKMGQLLTTNVSLHKISHIQLNYAFLLFWSIFGLIHWKLLFLVQKVTISERRTEILRKFIFLNKFERGKPRGKIGLV